MGDYSGTTTVDVDSATLFDYLSDVSNLPDYFARLTSAVPGDGEEIETTATMPDGQHVGGRAWFRVNQSEQRIEWGSEGPSAYAGYLDVSGTPGGSSVEVHVHTTRVGDGVAEVQDSVEETLSTIKRLVEQGHAIP
jgi:uncharacterized membrane protein